MAANILTLLETAENPAKLALLGLDDAVQLAVDLDDVLELEYELERILRPHMGSSDCTQENRLQKALDTIQGHGADILAAMDERKNEGHLLM